MEGNSYQLARKARRMRRLRRRRMLILAVAALILIGLLVGAGILLFSKPSGGSSGGDTTPTSSFSTPSGSTGTTIDPSAGTTKVPDSVKEMRKSFVICIDPGHGYDDPGSVGGSKGNLYEKDFNLETSLALRDALTDLGFTVVMTRDSDVPPESIKPTSGGLKKLSLGDRCNFANDKGCDLFISLHCDSCGDPSISGPSIYYYKDNSTTTSKYAAYVANSVSSMMEDKCGIVAHNRSESYQVCRNVKMPSVLVELGFISGSRDIINLQDSGWRHRMALAIALGIVDYYDDVK